MSDVEVWKGGVADRYFDPIMDSQDLEFIEFLISQPLAGEAPTDERSPAPQPEGISREELATGVASITSLLGKLIDKISQPVVVNVTPEIVAKITPTTKTKNITRDPLGRIESVTEETSDTPSI